jgi:hypothetical protein
MKKLFLLSVIAVLAIFSVSVYAYPYTKCTSEEVRQRLGDDFICVQSGDTLWDIYDQFVISRSPGWSRDDFASKNGIPMDQVNYIYPDQKLIIAEKKTTTTPVVEPPPVKREPEKAQYTTYKEEKIFDIYLREKLWERGVTFSQFLEENRNVREGGSLTISEGVTITIPKQAVTKPQANPASFIFDTANILSSSDEKKLNDMLSGLLKNQNTIVFLETINSMEGIRPLEYARMSFTDFHGKELDDGYHKNNLMLIFIKDYYGYKNVLVYYGYKTSEGGIQDSIKVSIDQAKLTSLKEQANNGDEFPLLSYVVEKVSDAVEAKRLKDAERLFTEADGYYKSKNYNLAERMLKGVYSECKNTIYGAKSMMVLAKLYADRGDHVSEYVSYWITYMKYRDMKTDWSDQYAMESLRASIDIMTQFGECERANALVKEYIKTYKYEPGITPVSLLKGRCEGQTPNDNCETLSYSGDPYSRMNVIFVSDDYRGQTSLFRSDAEKQMNNMFVSDIFNENKNVFNLYIYKISFKNVCDTDVAAAGNKLPTCGLPNEKVVFITFNPGRVENRNYGYAEKNDFIYTYSCVPTLPPILKYAVVHEMGHLIFSIRDEYVNPAKGDAWGKPNCAPDIATAKEWWGDLEPQGAGYYNGCSYLDKNIKGTKNSVMTDAMTADFGVVNEREIKNYFDRLQDRDSTQFDRFLAVLDKLDQIYGGKT